MSDSPPHYDELPAGVTGNRRVTPTRVVRSLSEFNHVPSLNEPFSRWRVHRMDFPSESAGVLHHILISQDLSYVEAEAVHTGVSGTGREICRRPAKSVVGIGLHVRPCAREVRRRRECVRAGWSPSGNSGGSRRPALRQGLLGVRLVPLLRRSRLASVGEEPLDLKL